MDDVESIVPVRREGIGGHLQLPFVENLFDEADPEDSQRVITAPGRLDLLRVFGECQIDDASGEGIELVEQHRAESHLDVCVGFDALVEENGDRPGILFQRVLHSLGESDSVHRDLLNLGLVGKL